MEQPQVEQPKEEQSQEEPLGLMEASQESLPANPPSTSQDQSSSETSQEPEPPASVEASQDVKPESEWPDPSSWDNISDIDTAKLPEAAQAHFNRLKELHESRAAEWSAEKKKVDQAMAELNDAKKTFHRLIEQMDDSGETKAVAVELDRFRGGFNNLASENIALAQRMFQLEHPDFAKYPKEVRDNWAKEMAHESFYSRYQGSTIYDKMKDSWRYALYRSGAKVQEASSSPQQPPPSKNQISRQGLVADGRRATSTPTPDPEDMSFDDILSIHDHLLQS